MAHVQSNVLAELLEISTLGILIIKVVFLIEKTNSKCGKHLLEENPYLNINFEILHIERNNHEINLLEVLEIIEHKIYLMT